MIGNEGDDVPEGWRHDDQFFGGGGNDTFHGVKDNDFLYGGRNHDLIYGGWGDDYLNGANGRDVLDGGKANDSFTGGIGHDAFVFKDNYDDNKIFDFRTNEGDKIDLIYVTQLTDFTEMLHHLSKDSAGNVIVGAGTVTITLIGYDLADFATTFAARDFIFG